MDKEEREDYPLLDSVGDEDDGRRSTEINIDMLPDRRDSFEVAKISSPEVVGPISNANHHHITSLQGVRPIHSTAVVKSTFELRAKMDMTSRLKRSRANEGANF